MREILGKSALVTGAASGIGRAIALKLADEGVRLFLVDINEIGLESVANDARLAGVDILVNNAGITYYGHTEQMSAEHWDRLTRVNLLSHIQFTRELLPSLLARPEAHVLNVCSMFGLVGMPKVAAYSTTKFALVGFSDALRAEYGR